jgi:hypothetical protein
MKSLLSSKNFGPIVSVLPALLLLAASSLFAQELFPLVNGSFEEPGAEERNWDNIPGWSLDQPAIDSGVAVGNAVATDGTGTAWLDSDDGVLWQLTDYTIQEGDVITLMADVRNSWQTTTFDLMLYYADAGTRVTIATTTGDFEGFVDDFLTEFSVTFSTTENPAAVGKMLGIAIQNTSIPNSFIEMDNFRLSILSGTSVQTAESCPTSFHLGQNYPNPFNPTTTIVYEVAEISLVRISIYNLTGELITTLVHSQQLQGVYSVQWNGTDDKGNEVPSGIYLMRMVSGSSAKERKLMLAR